MFFPWSHYYSSSLAPKGSKVKLYKLLSFTIVRQHRLWASDASTWPRLTASNAQISRNSSCTKSCPYAVLRIRDVGCSKLLGQLALVPNECLLSRASRSGAQIPSNSSCKLSFVHIGLISIDAFFPLTHYYSSSLAPKGSKVKLYKLLSFTIVRQHKLWASGASIWRRLTASEPKKHEFIMHAICPPAVLRIRDVGCSKVLGQLT